MLENLEHINKTPQNSPGIRFLGVSQDTTYGYSSDNPILLGGIDGNLGLLKAEILLGKLAGLTGEPLHFQHTGTCCTFETKDLFNNPRKAWLDVFEISHAGIASPRNLFFNLFREDELFIPIGLTLKD